MPYRLRYAARFVLPSHACLAFNMHQLQNSPDNRCILTLCDIRSLLSGDDFRSDLWRGLANTVIDCDKNILISEMTSLIYVIMHSRRQQVRTKLCQHFICFAGLTIKSANNA